MSEIKYFVFKKEDWDKKIDDNLHDLVFDRAQPIPDAVVIRLQDVFAPPALDAYANAILTAVEIMRADSAGYNSATVERLQRIAEYFQDQALIAWDTQRKVPD